VISYNTFSIHPLSIVQKMRPILLFLISGFLTLTCATVMQAQVTATFVPVPGFTPNQPIGPLNPGSDLAVELRMQGFQNMESMEFTISFDSTVLRVLSVTVPSPSPIPGFVADIFNTSNPNNNVFVTAARKDRIAVSWQYNPSTHPNGVSVPSAPATFGTRIFTINYRVLKACEAKVTIAKVLTSDKIEFVKVGTGGVSQTLNVANTGLTITGGDCPLPPPTYTGFKLIASKLRIPKGEIGCMPIRVNDMDSINVLLYAASWNSSVVDVVGVRALNLPGLDDPNAFAWNNTTGRMVTNWGSTNTFGETRSDLTAIYEVCFLAKGNPGASTPFCFNGNGFPGGTNPEVSKVKKDKSHLECHDGAHLRFRGDHACQPARRFCWLYGRKRYRSD
jgi:hypothetical protein